jgi:DNA-binding XRE family transcriptional regulator
MTKSKKFEANLEKLNTLIMKSGRKKSWIAEQMGIHQTTLTGWLKGKRKPSFLAVKMLAQILEVEVEDLEQKAA